MKPGLPYWLSALSKPGFLFATLLAAGLALHLANSPGHGPVYAGKTADQWLDAGYEDASMALQQIGPGAGPYVLAKLRREDPRYGSADKYHAIWTRLPDALRSWLPRPKTGAFDEPHACSALLELGPGIIPLLSKGLADKNPTVREVCAHALGALRQQGKGIGKATSTLVGALQDPVPAVRVRVVWALAQQAPAPK